RGNVAAALNELRAQYDTGADPAVVLTDLAEFTHFVTRVKVVPAVADDPALIEVERTRGRGFAEKLSMRVLSRAWQMLLKGIAEVGNAGRPLAAAEMVLVRIAYAADLPTPDEVVRALEMKPSEQLPSRGAAAAGSAPLSQASLPDQPRAALHPAPSPATSRLAGAPQATAEPEGQPRIVGRFEDLIALAVEKRDLGMKLALERDVRLVCCAD